MVQGKEVYDPFTAHSITKDAWIYLLSTMHENFGLEDIRRDSQRFWDIEGDWEAKVVLEKSWGVWNVDSVKDI